MARDWKVTNEDGKLVYTLTLKDGCGVLEVKEVPSRGGDGEAWYVFHEGTQLEGYNDVRQSINYCNELAEKLS